MLHLAEIVPLLLYCCEKYQVSGFSIHHPQMGELQHWQEKPGIVYRAGPVLNSFPVLGDDRYRTYLMLVISEGRIIRTGTAVFTIHLRYFWTNVDHV